MRFIFFLKPSKFCFKTILFIFMSLGLAHSIQAKQVEINVDGEEGVSANHGHSYSTYPGASFSNGRNGGDATSPTPGKNAGTIQAELKDISTSSSEYIMKLNFVADGESVRKTDSYELNLNQLSSILFSASGGNGKNGGNGGDGQGGCNGTDGSDATKFSSGDNGTPGCDGGDAGRGTSGSSGGNGGQVKIHVHEDDTHLLLKTRCDVKAGQGGDRGTHGRPGEGGRGGEGGSSYSWSESYDCRCGNRQSSNGNGSYSYTYECDTCTENHSKSGGFDGQSGSRGASQSANLFDGSDGKAGRCEVVVNENGMSKIYTNPFDVSVVSYLLEDENLDSIFEPNETITVKNIKIKNKNGVPTPAKKAQLQFYIASQGLMAKSSNQITIPQLKAGQEIVLSQSLKFRLEKVSVQAKAKSWSSEQDLSFSNFVTRVNESVSSLKRNDRFTVEFPFEVSSYYFPETGAAGETHPVIWKIKNKSSKKMSLKEELLKRNIKINFKYSSRKKIKNQIFFTDEFGRSHNLEQGFVHELVELEPNQELVLHGSVTIPKDIEPYSEIPVEYSLSLNTFNTDQVQKIQHQQALLKVSLIYKHIPDAEILFVTNKSVTTKQYNYWANLMNQLGLKFNVWDASYYNMLAFYKDYETNKSLARDFKDKNVIVLNAHHLTNQSNLYLDFFNLLSKNNTRILMIGGSEKNAKDLVNDIFLYKDADLNNSNNLISGLANKVKLTEFKFFGREVTDEKLKAELEKISQKLNTNYPEFRFTIKSKDQRVENTSFIGTQPMADVEIFRTISHQGSHLYVVPTLRELTQKQTILTDSEALRALFLSLSYDIKFKILFYNRSNTQLVTDLINQTFIYEIIGDLNFTKDLSDLTGKDLKLTVLKNFLVQAYKNLKYTREAFDTLAKVEWFLIKEENFFLNPTWIKDSTKLTDDYFNYVKTNNRLLCSYKPKDLIEKCVSENLDQRKQKIFSDLDKKYKQFKNKTSLSHKDIILNLFIRPAVDQVISTEDLTRQNIILEQEKK